MSKPFVSIIVPFRNAEKHMKSCIDSLLSQTYKHIEFIFVDNNSSDKTHDILQIYSSKLKSVILVSELTIGRGAARKKGEAIAKGDIIVMTDSDCIVKTNWIINIVKLFEKPSVFALQGLERTNQNNEIAKITCEANNARFSNYINKNITGKEILGLVDTKHFAIRKKALVQIIGSNASLISGNDTDLSIQLFRYNIPLFICDLTVNHTNASSLNEVKNIYSQKGYWMGKIVRSNIRYLPLSFYSKIHVLPFVLPRLIFDNLFYKYTKKPKLTQYNAVRELCWIYNFYKGLLK